MSKKFLTKQELIQKLSKNDNFPMDVEEQAVLSRDTDGNIELAGDICRVKTTPPPLFYYHLYEGSKNGTNISFANAEAEKVKSIKAHDFGECIVKNDSIRKIDGTWHCDVQPEFPREFVRLEMRVQVGADGNPVLDENGNEIPLKDDDGNILTVKKPKLESYLTVAINMVAFELDNEESGTITQKLDKHNAAKVRRAGQRERESAAADKKSSKGKSKPMSFAAYQHQLAQAAAQAEEVSSETEGA